MVLRCDRRLDGDIGTHRGRVAVKIAVESEQTRERETILRLAETVTVTVNPRTRES